MWPQFISHLIRPTPRPTPSPTAHALSTVTPYATAHRPSTGAAYATITATSSPSPSSSAGGIDWGLVLTAIGAVAGIVAAMAGIAAAYYAWRAFGSAEQSSVDATARRERDVQPRPNAGIEQRPPEPADTLAVSLSNAGGAVAPGFILVHVDNTLYGGRYTLPEHAMALTYYFSKRGEGNFLPTARDILIHIAKDIDGQWWDALAGAKLTDAPPEPLSSTEFGQWLIPHLEPFVRPKDQDAQPSG